MISTRTSRTCEKCKHFNAQQRRMKEKIKNFIFSWHSTRKQCLKSGKIEFASVGELFAARARFSSCLLLFLLLVQIHFRNVARKEEIRETLEWIWDRCANVYHGDGLIHISAWFARATQKIDCYPHRVFSIHHSSCLLKPTTFNKWLVWFDGEEIYFIISTTQRL